MAPSPALMSFLVGSRLPLRAAVEPRKLGTREATGAVPADTITALDERTSYPGQFSSPYRRTRPAAAWMVNSRFPLMIASSINPGPRPQRGKRWAQIQREQRQSPFYRLLDRSFAFRLLLAAGSALLLLMATNRWDHCRETGFGSGCLQRDAGGIISVANLEALSIATAAFLYLLEGRQRRQQQNLDALKLILTFQQAGAKLSYARNDALEQLSEAGLPLCQER